MIIKKIYHKDLKEFIESGEYQKSAYLPISSIRGLSQTNNPRAVPDDLVLVMVFENNEMQGYLGVLPDDLYFNNDMGLSLKEHAGWLSCMWVNPELRGKGIAKILINTVFEAWDYRILVTEFTAAAKGLYDRSGQFIDLAKPEGIRAYMRLNLSYLLPAKNPDKWAKFKFILTVGDKLANMIFDFRRLLIRKKKVHFSIITEIDHEARNFIEQNRSDKELMNRSITDLEWIVKNPWLNSGQKADDFSKRYHFSSVADFFAFRIMKVYNKENQLAALLILSIRDKNLKIPYSYTKAESTNFAAVAVEQFMREEKLNMLTLFQPDLVEAIKKNCSSFFLIRTLQRHYIISKKFEKNIVNSNSISIQDGDADVAFT